MRFIYLILLWHFFATSQTNGKNTIKLFECNYMIKWLFPMEFLCFCFESNRLMAFPPIRFFLLSTISSIEQLLWLRLLILCMIFVCFRFFHRRKQQVKSFMRHKTRNLASKYVVKRFPFLPLYLPLSSIIIWFKYVRTTIYLVIEKKPFR